MSNSEEKIRRAFENRDWNEIKVQDSWQIFKIMAEFVKHLKSLERSDPVFQYLVRQEPNPIILITNWQKKLQKK